MDVGVPRGRDKSPGGLRHGRQDDQVWHEIWWAFALSSRDKAPRPPRGHPEGLARCAARRPDPYTKGFGSIPSPPYAYTKGCGSILRAPRPSLSLSTRRGGEAVRVVFELSTTAFKTAEGD